MIDFREITSECGEGDEADCLRFVRYQYLACTVSPNLRYFGTNNPYPTNWSNKRIRC
jgi:hypothetical protein